MSQENYRHIRWAREHHLAFCSASLPDDNAEDEVFSQGRRPATPLAGILIRLYGSVMYNEFWTQKPLTTEFIALFYRSFFCWKPKKKKMCGRSKLFLRYNLKCHPSYQ